MFLAERYDYKMQMPVRVWQSETKWKPQWINVVFDRKHRTYVDDELGFIRETYYECSNPRLYYDHEGVPCLRSGIFE
jgi:hypothetical protein